MTSRERLELQVAAVIGAVLGGVTGYRPGRKRRMAQNTYLDAHWCSRRHWHDFLSSGLFVCEWLPLVASRRLGLLSCSRTTRPA
jgi:hypothetical protein